MCLDEIKKGHKGKLYFTQVENMDNNKILFLKKYGLNNTHIKLILYTSRDFYFTQPENMTSEICLRKKITIYELNAHIKLILYTTGKFISKKIYLRKKYEFNTNIKLILYTPGEFISKKICLRKKYELNTHIKLILYTAGEYKHLSLKLFKQHVMSDKKTQSVLK